MAKSTSLFLPVGANTQSITLTNADTTVAKLCFTAGSNDSDIKAIVATSDDTAAINLKVYITRGGVDYLLGTVNIPIASGTNGTVASVDILSATPFPGLPVDSVGKRYIPLKNGDTLKVACLATMTSGKTCTVNVLGQDY
jgi:hypothetical protein